MDGTNLRSTKFEKYVYVTVRRMHLILGGLNFLNPTNNIYTKQRRPSLARDLSPADRTHLASSRTHTFFELCGSSICAFPLSLSVINSAARLIWASRRRST